MSDWTEEKIARLRKMHARGVPFGEIAMALHVSRGAALGKAFRLGLSVPKGVKAARSVTRSPRRIDNDGAMIRRGGVRSFVKEATFIDLPTEASPAAVTFMNLKRDTCRWPISGDGRDVSAMLFCGAPQAEEGCSYCEAHKLRSIVRREAA